MERRRATDWLIGALGMLVVLVLAGVLFWWVMTDPADEVRAEPAPTTDGGVPSAATPPADLGEDEVWLADLTFDSGTVIAEGSTLRDVHAVGQDVVSGENGLVAARLAVDVTVPFEVIAGELGDGSVVSAAEDGQVRVVRTVQVLGRDLEVDAAGTVDVVAGRLVMEPRSIDVGGPEFLSDALAAVARRFVTIEQGIDGLPEGLELQDAVVQDDGLRATLRGEGVPLGS